MDYACTVSLDLPYAQAVPKVKDAFKAQGFGVLTEIDLQATIKEKPGEDMERYLIAGACNPDLARRALEVTRDIGLLLPYNVVVRGSGGGVLVQALDATIIATVAGLPAWDPIAAEAGTRLAALEWLAAPGQSG